MNLEELKKQFINISIPTGLTLNTEQNQTGGHQKNDNLHKDISVSVYPAKFINLE